MRISANVFAVIAAATTFSSAATAAPPAVDNSAANAGDASKYAVTAQNQDNKHGDVKKLGKIRRHITSEKGLSMDAKNIKILVSKSEVILKGPVKNEAEKVKLEEIAKSCCPELAVVSQITVVQK